MIKKLICKLFGHVYVKEVYAAPLMHNPHRWGLSKKLNALDVESIFPLNERHTICKTTSIISLTKNASRIPLSSI